MAVNAAHNRWWQTFEVVFGVPMAIAIVLQLVLPVSFPRGFSKLIFIAGGVALILSGGILIIFARREFAKHGQPTEPGLPTSKVVTTGVFSLSRNPLYLGGICMLVGIAFALDSPWVHLSCYLPLLPVTTCSSFQRKNTWLPRSVMSTVDTLQLYIDG
jgi:protein-S-isoprenylcysteine O-methyltransferase Ste14